MLSTTKGSNMTTVFLTGASGYIGKHITLQLLSAGYTVRASVRSSAKGTEVVEALRGHLENPELLETHLSFVELDLTSDAGWSEALEGVDALLHTASPFTIDPVKDENVLIRPAVDGTLRAMKAAHAAGVHRVVLTSSVAAIQGRQLPEGKSAFDESMWTDVNSPLGNDPYTKSKTLAEEAAWEFVKHDAPEMLLTTINPSLVLGAPLDRNFGTSVAVLERLLSAKDPALPDVSFSIVDVKDVATLHVLSLDLAETAGQRYVASAGALTFIEMAKVLKAAYPKRKIVTRQAPKFLLQILALFDGQIKAILPSLGNHTRISSAKAQSAFAMQFISPEQSIVETAAFLLQEEPVRP